MNKVKLCPHCGSVLVPSWDNKYLYCLKCFKYKEIIK